MKVFFKWIACVAAIWLSNIILGDSVVHYDTLYILLGAGTLLWLVNLTIKPILHVLSFPITIMTLGLFSFVLSVLMVALTDFLISQFEVRGIFPLILIAILVSVITSVLNTAKKK